MAICCNKSWKGRESMFGGRGGIFSTGKFQSIHEDTEFTQNVLHFFFQGKKTHPSQHIWACQGICILRREPNMGLCNRLKIPFKSLCTMWRGFFLNAVCVPKEKEEHKVIGRWQPIRQHDTSKIYFTFQMTPCKKWVRRMHLIIGVYTDLSLLYKGRQQPGKFRPFVF